MRALAILATITSVACGAPASTARTPAAAAPIRLAFVDDRAVHFAVVEAGAIRIARTVATPGTIVQLDWVGDDPVVRIGSTPMRFKDGEPVATSDDDPKLIGQIARITARGYEPFARLPDETWRDVQPKPDQQRMEDWGLRSSPDGSIWQGYCGNAFTADGQIICDLLYARLAPAPVITSKSPPSADVAALFEVAPPAEPALEFVPLPPGEEKAVDDAQLLRCRDRGTTIELPTPDRRGVDFRGMGKATWLSADPPLFRVHAAYNGFSVTLREMIVERCRETGEYGTEIATGPDGEVAVFGGASLLVLHRGRIVGRIAASPNIVRFAPR